MEEDDIEAKRRDKNAKMHGEAKAPLDLDWMDLNRRVGGKQSKMREVSAQLQADCAFLASKKMLDYSLLLGVYDVQGNEGAPELDAEDGPVVQGQKQPVSLTHNGNLDEAGENLYLFGIIDITERKRIKWMIQGPILSNLLKCGRTCFPKPEHNPDSITAVEPDAYADRFVEFMQKIVLRVEEDPENPICGISGPFSLDPDYDLDASDAPREEEHDGITVDIHPAGSRRQDVPFPQQESSPTGSSLPSPTSLHCTRSGTILRSVTPSHVNVSSLDADSPEVRRATETGAIAVADWMESDSPSPPQGSPPSTDASPSSIIAMEQI